MSVPNHTAPVAFAERKARELQARLDQLTRSKSPGEQWTSVTTATPPDEDRVLIFNEDWLLPLAVGYIFEGTWLDYDDLDLPGNTVPTHWMHLPEPPKLHGATEITPAPTKDEALPPCEPIPLAELPSDMLRITGPNGEWVDDLKVHPDRRDFADGFVTGIYSQRLISSAELERLHCAIEELCPAQDDDEPQPLQGPFERMVAGTLAGPIYQSVANNREVDFHWLRAALLSNTKCLCESDPDMELTLRTVVHMAAALRVFYNEVLSVELTIEDLTRIELEVTR